MQQTNITWQQINRFDNEQNKCEPNLNPCKLIDLKRGDEYCEILVCNTGFFASISLTAARNDKSTKFCTFCHKEKSFYEHSFFCKLVHLLQYDVICKELWSFPFHMKTFCKK